MANQKRRPQQHKKRLGLWFESAQEGDVTTLVKLLEKRHIPHVDVKDENHCTALHLAAQHGSENCVVTLLDLGADPNSLSIHGTPARMALENGNLRCLALLLRGGADLKAKNHDQQTLLDCINQKLSAREVEKLLKQAERQKKKKKPSKTQRTKTADNLKGDSSQSKYMDADESAQVCKIRAPVVQVLSREIQPLDGNVYSNHPFSYYIEGGLRGGSVTLKRYRWQLKEDIDFEHFHQEVSFLSDLRHPNILLLMAVSSSPDPSQRGLVLEHIERGFLYTLLHKEKTVLDENTVLGVSRDVACAMQFVHQRGYIHCYLASNSVTLTENYTAKICNFEYAQRIEDGKSVGHAISHLEILYDYMAPDQLIGKPADQSCDVFSFGVLVWECITRKLPLKHIKSLAKFAKKTVDPRLHKIPANCSQNFKALITDCLKTALERPNFQQIYGWLSAVITSQYASLRPTTFFVDKQEHLFATKNVKSPPPANK
ncbi:dual specificity protein kinase shkC-like [Montipora capricornis]|uniref:dual specificity protein kinase shkC-like n=1 Tax=Montipora capricornis TaxID=246305 RepID=UPI0035F1BCA6